MIRGEVVRLFPTPEQEKMFRMCIGYARFSYNYCKEYDDNYVKTHNTRLSAFDLAKVLVKLKYTEGYEWMQRLPSDIAKQAASDFGAAKKNSKRIYKNASHTNYKKKNMTIDNLSIVNIDKLKSNQKSEFTYLKLEM